MVRSSRPFRRVSTVYTTCRFNSEGYVYHFRRLLALFLTAESIGSRWLEEDRSQLVLAEVSLDSDTAVSSDGHAEVDSGTLPNVQS